MVLELLDDLVVLTQFHPLFTPADKKDKTVITHVATRPSILRRGVGWEGKMGGEGGGVDDDGYSQALVGRELVERQVLRAPAGVGAFVETAVHVRRHGDGGGVGVVVGG